MAIKDEITFPAQRPLWLLIVEDDPVDAELMVAVLKRAGYLVRYDVVDAPDLFESLLAKNHYDLILCDHNLGTWVGTDALAMLRATGKDIPFVVATAALGDEAAVDYVKQGAADYVLKHRVERLPVAVGRALREKAFREETARLQDRILCAKREWELTFDAVPDPVLVLGEGFRIQRANRAAAQLFGLDFPQLIGKSCCEVVHGSDRPPEACPFKRMLANGESQRCDIEVARLGRVFSVVASPIRVPSGSLQGGVEVMRDITRRKCTEQELIASETRYRRLFEAAKDGIVILDWKTHQIVDANPFLLELLGYSHEELVGKKLWDIGPFRDVVASRINFEELREKDYIRYEDLPLESKDGREIAVEFVSNAYLVGDEKVIQCNIRDITARELAEEALRESEERFRSLTESTSDWIWEIDRAATYTYASPKVKELLGYEPQEVLGKSPLDFMTPEDASRLGEFLKTLLESPQPFHRLESKNLHKEGGLVALEASGVPVWSAEGAFHGYHGIARDVTDRQRNEEDRARLTRAVEQVAESVVITDPAANIVYVNPHFEKVTGYSRQEVLGKHVRTLKSGRHSPEFYRGLWETLLRGGVWSGLFVNRRKDGSLFEEEAVISPVRDATGRVVNYVAVKRDVTHEKQLEQQLRQAHKMEAVGKLAGGIAHDFNNLLGVIIGYSELLLEELEASDSRSKRVQEITKAAERAASLTRQLLAFSRKQILEPRVVCLNAIISDLQRMLLRLIGEDIELITALSPALGNVKADAGQVEQVLINLAVNARDAMPQGGKLTIETSHAELDESYARAHVAVAPGPYVCLAVSDTGVGMNKETQAHIFEPFFTTKKEGTGLGLATVYGIVKQSGGNIWVYSEPGKGTTFKIYLPRVESPVEPTRPAATGTVPARGTETVLLVEDAEPLRELARELLEGSGYVVLEAGNGAEALEIAAQHQGLIHLLLADVVMPTMSGSELAEKLQAMRPEVRVLYVSGYTEEAITHHGVVDPGTSLLTKPFTREILLHKVREILDACTPQKT